MAITKIELTDLNGKEINPEELKDPDVIAMAVEVGAHRTVHILDRRVHNFLTAQESLIMAYLQGRFDVEMEVIQADAEAKAKIDIDNAFEAPKKAH